MTAIAAARTSPAYKPVGAWARTPGAPHRCIADVSIDSHDFIHAYSRDNQAVFVYDRDGNFVKSWGEGRFPGRAHGKFTPDGKLLLTPGTSGKPADTGYDMKKRTQLEKNATRTASSARSQRPTASASIRTATCTLHRTTGAAAAAPLHKFVLQPHGNLRPE